MGATDQLDHRTSFSNYGANLDVVAPGLGIEALNYTNFGSLVSVNGTSLSSPIVAGIASLLKGYNTNLYNDDIEQLIKLSADDQGVAGRDDLYGYGRVNASTALKYLNPPYQLTHLTSNGGTNYSSSDAFLIMLGTLGVHDGFFHVKKIEVRKTITLPNNYCSITGVWGTGLKTTGWHDNVGYCYGDGFCEVVPGSQTATQVTLRTYVYQLYTSGGLLGGYYPTSPQNVTFAYSILGIPEPTTISGDASFCTTSNPYTIPGLPTGATVTWSASPYGIVQINSPNSPSTTLTNIGSGIITLTATVNNVCGTNQIVLNKQVTVGNQLTGTITQSGNNTPMYTVNSIAAGPTSVTFQWPGVSGISCYQSSSNPSVSQTGFIYYAYNNSFWFTLSAGQSITVNFSGTGCGGTTIATRSFTVSSHHYIVTPNPATNTVTFSPNTQSGSPKALNDQESSGAIRLVTITDVTGVVRQRQSFAGNTNTVQMNVSNLPRGNYFVEISAGNHTETLQLLINK